MQFEVKLPDIVIDELSHFPYDVRKRIANSIKSLEKFPFPHGNTIRKIHGTNKPIYRLRVGDYRVIYNIDMNKRQILVLTVVHRQRLEQALRTIL